MANIHIRFGEIMPGDAPVYQRVPRSSEVITSSGSNQTTTMTATGGDYATITAIDGAVYVDIAASPNASTNKREAVPSGGTKDFGPLKEGDKVAVVDV